MSSEPSYRIDNGTEETHDDSRAGHHEQGDVAGLQQLFEDVTGTTEFVDEQDTSVSSREITEESSMSEALDDGLGDAIDEPDVNDAL